jgi:chromosome segregation protein
MKPRLKALELHGYKTFASRVQFEFPGNITAIVGPNGSGKSNIADALRWVLGEQSYTMLRGKKTEDMIFYGSDQRPRAGMASATVTFDNEESWLPIDYTEVSVARRAYRDGDNEYLLNRQKVRLKDISELLAQSGLAERTYTIIGQGLVDAALSLRPEERRRFFEEAAGIGLFRGRREESINRLDSTRRNLERVQDILSELEPRLRSLERQAKKADDYDHIKADLHILLKDWYGFHWQNTQKELLRAREILKNQAEKVTSARNKSAGIEGRVQNTRAALAHRREELSKWHAESAGLHSNREKTSRELAVLDERYRSLKDQEVSLRNDLGKNEQRTLAQNEQLTALLEEKNHLQGDLEEAQESLKEAQKQLETRQADREKVDLQLRQKRRELSDLETKQVQLRAHQRELSTRFETQQATTINLVTSIKTNETSLKSISIQRENASQKLEIERVGLTKLQRSLEKNEEEIKVVETEGKALFESLSRMEMELVKLRAQFDVLVQAENALSGMTEGAKNLIQAAKQGKLKGQFKTISALLDVPAEYETAISSVLGDHLDGIILDAATDAETVLAYLEGNDNGRTILVPPTWIRKSEKVKSIREPGVIGIASDLVKGSTEINPLLIFLLGQVVLVNNRSTARKIISLIPESGRVVTLKGEVFLGTGVVIAGKDNRAATLGRPRQKKEIEERIGELSSQVTEQKNYISSVKIKTNSLLEGQNALLVEIKDKKALVDQLTRDEQLISRTFEQQQQKSEWQNSQLELINTDLSKTTGEISSIDGLIKEGSEKILVINALMHELNNQLRTVPLDEFQTQVIHWTTTVAVNSRGVLEANRRYAEFEQGINQNRITAEQTNGKLQSVLAQIQEVDVQKSDYSKNEKGTNQLIQELQIRIDPAEIELQELEKQYSALQEEYTLSQQFELNTDRASAQAQLELSRIEENLINLRRKIEDDFGLVTLEYSKEITGPTPLPLEGVNELKVLTEIPLGLEDSINRQRALLRRMGAVNPDAQKEFYEVKERFDFLTQQMADLRKADADLRQIISELDELMRKQFRTTFNAVAIEFKALFTRLFGGGSAKLVLTDDENPTETGIDIEAKLPGRREQGLSLLSGGERALTAVALIFSLLKVSPTPFCVMDEVDAMLDEANVVRFTELLKELSSETQFIVITHNRNTVQVADVIYGVTMGRDSASQVISLRLDEVSDDMVKK